MYLNLVCKMKSVEERVLSIVRERSFMGDEVNKEDGFSAIGINSIDLVDVIVSLEDEFGIYFSDSILNIEKFKTVENVIEMVNSLLALQ